MFDTEVLEAARLHAEKEYPKESCGLITDKGYEPQENIAKEPEKSFKISREILAEKQSIFKAIIHSHPDGPYYPSKNDMQGQLQTAVPWGVIYVDKGVARNPFFFGDQIPIPPLEGRYFQHGVTDCYSLVRDWFRVVKDILLDEFPRDWEWWLEPGLNLYEQKFRSQGFEIIEPSEVKEGDCFLAQIRSPVVNHAGVYVGNGLILHQLGMRGGFSTAHPSCKQPVYRWQKYIRHWVRKT